MEDDVIRVEEGVEEITNGTGFSFPICSRTLRVYSLSLAKACAVISLESLSLPSCGSSKGISPPSMQVSHPRIRFTRIWHPIPLSS